MSDGRRDSIGVIDESLSGRSTVPTKNMRQKHASRRIIFALRLIVGCNPSFANYWQLRLIQQIHLLHFRERGRHVAFVCGGRNIDSFDLHFFLRS